MMKKNTFLKTFALFAGIFLIAATSGWGQETIHYWSFNDGENSELDAGNNEPTSIPADIGDGVINHELSFNSFTGSIINAEPGFVAGQDWAVAGSDNIGKSFEMVFSTEGFDNVLFSFAAQRSGAGYDNNTIEVSTDGGTSWETVVTAFDIAGSYTLYNYDLSGIDSEVDDNSEVIVRFTFDVDDASGGGNNRFDNIKITAGEPEPEEPAFTTLPYEETFETDLGDCYVFGVSGESQYQWSWHTFEGETYARANGFGSDELVESWLIVPGIDMDVYDQVTMNFESAYNFGGEDVNNYLKLYYSTNYAGIGDPTGADWTEIPFTKPAVGNYTWASSGNLDLSAISGTVWLGFKYHYSENFRLWQVTNIYIDEVPEDPDPELAVDPASLTGLSYITGEGPSDAQSFDLTGSNLDGSDATITAPADFEISESETGPYGSAITLTAYDGAATTIWVRLSAGLAIADYSGNVEISGGGADPITVAVSGSVAATPTTDLPFTTNFGIDGNWWADGTMGSYNEKSYTEGGWYFHSTEAVRGGAAESYNGSPYSFRDRLVFTVYNEASISGMTGFSLQLRDWMASETLDRDLNISFDGGTAWETILTINKDWFDAFQVYQQFIYFFDDPQDFAAEGFQLEIVGGIAGSNDGRINIGQFEALVDDPDDLQDATLAIFTVGGVDVLGLGGLVVDDPVADPGATLEVEDFTDFTGIVVETTDPAASFTVSLNGILLDHGDLPDQPIAENDVIVVTVTSANGTVVRHHKVTVIAEEEPVELITNGFFQHWTDGLPDGWYGDKSNIGTGNVNQYSANPHSGSYSAQLVRESSAHRRFTSQPTQVSAGSKYKITFWVKGQGEIRTGLFDDRETGFGYAPYNDYIVVDSDTWTEHTQHVTAENTTDIAEFIFSVRNTEGNDRSVSGHVLLDSVSVDKPTLPDVMIPLPIWVIFLSGLLMAGFIALRRRK